MPSSRPRSAPPRSSLVRLCVATACAAVFAAVATGPADAASTTFGPAVAHNPYAGPDGSATMHGDSASSDTTPLPGPGAGTLTSKRIALASACPTVLIGSDGYPVALCTPIFGQVPTVHLLDPADGDSIATLTLTKGSLLGGVYAYLDQNDRLVVIDGSHRLLRIGHHRGTDGSWSLSVDSALSLTSAVPSGDDVTGIAPDWQGRVWFATGGGVVGTADDRTGVVRTLQLPAGERVDNSISTAPAGTLVTTTYATYLLTASSDGTPQISWRQAYDRGTARKPGQLSPGSGSTPTFFGPTDGTDYVAIVDNADTREKLQVYATSTGRLICSTPVLVSGGPGSENSPIGAGRSVFVASTYGYPYPKVPDDAGTSVPASADFTGGLTRVDVRADGSGCDLVWDNKLRSAAVPKLSTGDGKLHTVLRDPLIPGTTGSGILDPYRYAEIDPNTGQVTRSSSIGVGSLYDTLQMAGNAAPGGVWYQGTVTGVVRISGGQ
ncbi:hypothetical protein [Streptomyces sp. NPDC008150]|uniref:hypothetical protein n=1 Tax=Streptomyces sp. NPDC008150 TaxID=3364816 RepID=UPI0036E24B78